MAPIISISLLIAVFMFNSKETSDARSYLANAISITAEPVNNGHSEKPVSSHGKASLPVPAHRESKVHKIYVPKMEELAKIHRFHRERVKKVKRHHGKLWVFAKILLFMVHLAILTIAYLHHAAH